MGRRAATALFVLVAVVVVVVVDAVFLRHNVGARLIVNVGLVLVFGAFYLRFLRQP